MVALLYETTPRLKAIWIEYLYKLASYRMAIEDPGTRDKKIWGITHQY
jgi:hypothetical protein